MAKTRTRRRPGGLQFVMFVLFALALLTIVKSAREQGAEAAKGIAETMTKGVIASTAAAFAARWALVRLGLVFLAPWAAGAAAIAAFAAVGAWKLSASELGLPGGISYGDGGGPECDGQLRYFDPTAGVWRCADAAS